MLARAGAVCENHEFLCYYVSTFSWTTSLLHAAAAACCCYACTLHRHFLESTARQLVASNDRVSIQYGVKAAGLVFEGLHKAGSSSSSSKKAAVTGEPTKTLRKRIS
jgi:hypothetical protein